MDNYPKKRKKLSDRKKFIIVICVVTALCCAYAVRAAYYNATGKITTQVINTVTHTEYIETNAIAIRDEGTGKGDKNTCVLKKTQSGIYTPNISNGESVSKNECIAYVFGSESMVNSFNRSKELTQKIATLTKLQESGNIGKLNLDTLTNQVYSDVKDYISLLDDNNLSSSQALCENIVYDITSRQIITGQNVDFSHEIKKLKLERDGLKNITDSAGKVNAPCAGYFVNSTDGYEGQLDYEKAQREGFSVKQFKKMQKLKASKQENSFGKIIGEHAWFLVCVIPYSQSRSLSVGSEVNVSFTQRGINDTSMTVHKISRSADEVCITLRCLTMNSDMLDLRNEKVKIAVASYTGFKINSSALREKGDKVYVFTGSYACLKPVKVIFTGDDYVIAQKVTTEKITDEKTGETEEKEIKQDRILKEYDRVIVKGRNLYDGKVIS